MKINIDDITIGDARRIAQAAGLSSGSAQETFEDVYTVGACYLVRCVTHITLGKLVRSTRECLVFDDASWVADTGRYGEVLAKGAEKLNEVERVPDGHIVHRGSIVDADRWLHDLPKETK